MLEETKRKREGRERGGGIEVGEGAESSEENDDDGMGTSNCFVVCAIAATGDGRLLFAGSSDGSLSVWDTDTSQGSTSRRLQRVRGAHSDWIRCLAVSPVERRGGTEVLISGSRDNTVRVWQVVSPFRNSSSRASTSSQTRSPPVTMLKLVSILRGHTDWVRCLSTVELQRDEKTEEEDNSHFLLLSASDDCTIREWDLGYVGKALLEESVTHKDKDEGERLKQTQARANRVRVVTDCQRGFNVGSCPRSLLVSPHCGASPSFFYVGIMDFSVRKVERETGRVVHILTGHTGLVTCMDYSYSNSHSKEDPDPSLQQEKPTPLLLYTGSDDSTIRQWSVESGHCLRVFDGHSDWIRGIKVSLKGDVLYSGSADCTLRAWETEAGGGTDTDLSAIGQTTTTSNHHHDNDHPCCVVRPSMSVLGHKEAVWDLEIINTDTLVSSSADGRVKYWCIGLPSVWGQETHYLYSQSFKEKVRLLLLIHRRCCMNEISYLSQEVLYHIIGMFADMEKRDSEANRHLLLQERM